MKKLLEANLALNKENNELLLKVYGIQRWGQIMRVIYWFVIIGISVGAFYFIEPFLASLGGAYGVDTSSIGNILK